MNLTNYLAQRGIGGFYKRKERIGISSHMFSVIQLKGPFQSQAAAEQTTIEPDNQLDLFTNIHDGGEHVAYYWFHPQDNEGQKSSDPRDLYMQTVTAPS